ncbi:small toxic polypeptide ldrD [Kluyvera genomosp. 2]|uniref:Small toxic polypeptide ldrD n=1 Tax=Kluyvera genomosp. 2 TaxID=2774054 RepID=A0A2T2Y5M6_9ENTR|nr:small toxic polypeptide ldrD [Kluyvera genomosp. 2]
MVLTWQLTRASTSLHKDRIAANRCHCNAGGYMTLNEALALAVVTSIVGPLVVALIRHFFKF